MEESGWDERMLDDRVVYVVVVKTKGKGVTMVREGYGLR
jgi:hypothetical protein